MPPKQPTKQEAAPLRANLTNPAGGDSLDDLAGEMGAEWQEVMAQTVAPIQAALASASTLEEFRDGLEGVLSELDSKKLATLLARGQFAARAWGQVNQPKK